MTVQLGLLLLVIHLFQVEQNFGFLRLTPLILGGFIIHSWLPLSFRLPFFLLLSAIGIGIVLGLQQGVALMAIGLCLIGICHVPAAFAARVALLLGAGAGLVALRAEWIKTPWTSLPTLVLPVLGAIFMFRLIIYLYDLRHEKKPATLWERLAYFFMLPNVCFLLFPVVDYQTYRRTYYNADSITIYQKGLLWMYRGVMHLLLYRLVYYHLVPSPSEVQALGGVVQSMVATYLLYLRISGQFHLIVGILCLFGFNLPETHHLYFLASSFNDYWRRINIYWKDFMMKIFYYPSLMQLRRWGMTTALIGSTLMVFIATWALHSYQWFWLRGTFPVTAPDMLFWAILGGLVVVNSLFEARRSRKRSLKKPAWSLRGAFVHALKTLGMFVTICVLWSFWSSPSVGDWFSMVSKAGNTGPAGAGLLLLALAGLVAGGVLVQYAMSRGWTLTLVGSQPSFARSVAVTSAGMLLLLVFWQLSAQGRLDGQMAGLVASVREERLNQQDGELMERGYYEGLLNAEKYTSALWTVQVKKPKGWDAIMESEAVRPADGVLVYELIPSLDTAIKNVSFRTNQWGMHDRAYEREKAPETFRIALIGSSYAMGAGVERNRTFEALLEDQLNREHAGGAYTQYEVLNFSVGGYSVLQNVQVVEEKVFSFDPDMLFFIVHSTENRRLRGNLVSLIGGAGVSRYALVQEVIQAAGLEQGMGRSEMQHRLEPYLGDIIGWGFRQIAEACRERGVMPVWIFVPSTEETQGMDSVQFSLLSGLAHQAGGTVLSLEGAYGEHDEASIQLASWDTHLSVLGHKLVADKLYQVLLEHEHQLHLGLLKPTVVQRR